MKAIKQLTGLVLLTLFSIASKAQVGCQADFIPFNNPNDLLVNFQDSSFASGPYDSVSLIWIFGDGQFETSSLNAFVQHDYSVPGTYTVCLGMSVYSGGIVTCFDSICHIIDLDTNSNPCSGFSSLINNTPGSMVLEAFPLGGTAPYSYIWSNGVNTSAMMPNSNGLYCVTITDANGCTASTCYTLGGGGGCNWNVYANENPLGFLWAEVDSGVAAQPVTYVWSNGAVAQEILTAGLASGTYCVTAIDANQCSAVACVQYNAGPQCLDTICGTAFNDANGNGVLDNGEQPIANMPIMYYSNFNQGTATTNANGVYSFTVPCGSFVGIFSQGNNTFPLITMPANSNPLDSNNIQGGYQIQSSSTLCGYDFGFSNNVIYVYGTVYADLNNNGSQNAGESGISYQTVNFGSFSTYTDWNGNYSIMLPLGTYSGSCSPSGYYAGLSSLPASININGTTSGQTFSNQNFGIQIPAGSVNLAVNMSPHTTVTPGFPAWYSIYVCNVGATPAAGTVNLFFDNALVYDNASPAPTSYNNTTHTATWTTPTITPGNCQYIWVDFNALTTVPLGSSTFELVNVVPTSGSDIQLSNNVDTVHQIVVGSWDPNNKLSVETNHNNAAFQYSSAINSNQQIEYTINFQNTGTAPAVNVVVKDILSADLDPSSFQLINTSHPCVATRNGNNLNFKFTNIMLADSFNNEPESHGFITFKVNALPGLTVGHVISDDADIYFDFNDPVNTGFSTVTIVDVDAIEEGKEAATVLVAPHPVRDYAVIRLSETSLEGFELVVTDMMGRSISKTQTETNEIRFNRNQLATGMYTYQIVQNGKKVASGKLVIE